MTNDGRKVQNGGRSDQQKPTSEPGPDEEEEDDECDTVLPPDGGWGWVVVVVGFMGGVIVDGIIFSFGIVFSEILNYYDEGKSKTAWVGSVMAGMYLTVGPIVSALANRFGCKNVAIAGSLLASLGLLLSFFAPSINFLIFSYGILGGIGFGLVYLPCIVMVQFYFDKKRAFATGISVCGSGMGAFIFAPLSTLIINEYGWRGNMLIQSAIVMHMVAFAMLLRPLGAGTRSSRKRKALLQAQQQQVDTEADATKTDDNKFHKSHSAHSFGAVEEELGNDSPVDHRQPEIKEPAPISRFSKPTSTMRIPSLTIEEAEEEDDSGGSKGSDPSIPLTSERHRAGSELTAAERDHQENRHNELLSLGSQSEAPTRRISMVNVRTQKSSVPEVPNYSRRKSLPVSISDEVCNRPFYRQDIFYSGSLLRISQYASQHSLQQYHCSVVSIPRERTQDEERGGNCLSNLVCPKAMRHTIGTMLDFSLLQSVTFIVLCVSSFITMMGFFVPFVYLADYATEVDVDMESAGFLFSVIGISNTLGRVFSGWVSDRPKVDALLITNVALTMGGVATAFVPLLHTYELLIVYSLVFGLAIACFASLRSIILVELLGLEKLTNAFGLLLLFQGVASMVGSPLAGFFYDITKSYDVSFMIAGSLIALSGIMGFPLPYISRWENRRNELKKKENELVS